MCVLIITLWVSDQRRSWLPGRHTTFQQDDGSHKSTQSLLWRGCRWACEYICVCERERMFGWGVGELKSHPVSTGYLTHLHLDYRVRGSVPWSHLSCLYIFLLSLSDSETHLIPLAGKLHGDALWLGVPSMHPVPITFTVSKRLKNVRIFKSIQRSTKLFRLWQFEN